MEDCFQADIVTYRRITPLTYYGLAFFYMFIINTSSIGHMARVT